MSIKESLNEDYDEEDELGEMALDLDEDVA